MMKGFGEIMKELKKPEEHTDPQQDVGTEEVTQTKTNLEEVNQIKNNIIKQQYAY